MTTMTTMTTKTIETLEKFTKRMSQVAKEEELCIGSQYRGHSRAVFKFENQYCYLEQIGYKSFPARSNIPKVAQALIMTFGEEPSDYWWTDYMSYGKERAELIALHYGATIEEAPYAMEVNTWFYYVFDKFEDLMRFVYDRHTGKFIELWGKEPILYRSCIGDGEPEEMT